MRIDARNNANGEVLLLSASQAAKLLGISRKTLWNHTSPRGMKIPAVRIGKVLRYRRTTLEQWIVEREGALCEGTG